MRSGPLLAAAVLCCGAASAQSEFSIASRRSMTGDPGTNPQLARFVEPLESRAEELSRTLRLAMLLHASCSGSALDGAGFSRLLDAFRLLPGSEQRDAVRSTALAFDYMDVDRLAHLCAGVDFFFGARGALAPHLMAGWTGHLYPAGHAVRYGVEIPPVLFDR